MIRRFVIQAVFLLLVPLAAAAASHRPDPLLFHVHGLSFSSDGKSLIVPSHHGLAVYRDGSWFEESGPARDFTGFAVTARAIYASGHPSTDARRAAYFGLLKSTDEGRTWQSLALAGEADFHLLAAGFRSGAIYALAELSNSAMPTPGLYVTYDEGKTWRRAAAAGLAGALHGLAAHPTRADLVAAAGDRGLFVSDDAGGRFRRLDGRQTVTSAAFDARGERIGYVHALSHEVASVRLDGKERRAMRLPPLGGDYVTHLAQNAQDERSLAVATRRRSVLLTQDRGITWREIAREGDLP